MTDKEFKQLTRPQLIEIIYQLQLQIEKLTDRNRALEKALENKRLQIDNAGNIAQAALEINNCFRAAQDAADQYLNEIKIMREETEAEREQILADAYEEASAILARAQKRQIAYDSAIDAILKEYEESHSDNG